MKTTRALDVPEAENPHGMSLRPLYASPHFSAIHLMLGSGQSSPQHPAPVDLFFYVLEGSGLIEVGGDSAQVAPDMVCECPAGTAHRLANTGSGPLRILVVRAPQSSTPPRFVGEI